MPFHRRIKRTPKPGKPPKQAAPPRPAVRELKEIYKALYTTDIGQRLASLIKAFHWYELGLMYLAFKYPTDFVSAKDPKTQQPIIVPRDPAEAKSMDRAIKSRLLGLNTTYNAEKETAFRTALKLYEKVCAKLEPPGVDLYYAQLDSKAAQMQEKQARMEIKYGTITELLAKALKPVNAQGQPVTLQVGHVQDPYRMDPERSQLTLRRDVVKELRHQFRRQGLLAVVRTVLDPVSRICCMKPKLDEAGKQIGYEVTWKDMYETSKKLLDNLIAFGATDEAPKRMVRPAHAAKAMVAGQAKPRVPRAPGVGGLRQGPKLVDAFVIGSDIAKVFTQLADGQEHDMAALQKMITAQLRGRLRVIHDVGQRKQAAQGKGWSVEINGTKTRVVFSSPEIQQAVIQAAKTATP